MNLVIDVGNTYLKVAVFKNDHLEHVESVLHKDSIDVLKKIDKDFDDLDKVIISSVSGFDTTAVENMFSRCKTVFLDHKTPLPFFNLYKTPKTLGVDRMALVASAVKKFPNQNALIIDAGTCITFDFINEKKEYFGGSIAPGLLMRYKSLSHFTAKLPALTPKLPENDIGDCTENAIHVGVSGGIIAEINGMINQFSNKYEHLVVILSGGDAKFLSKRLKNSIFVDPNFLLHGLNYILEHTID